MSRVADVPDLLATRLGAAHRLLLALRIGADAVRVWGSLRRSRLPQLVRRLDRPGRVRRPVEPRRLGRLVYRVMNLGPFRPRCLAMSLVLFRELRRQDMAAVLAIGLPHDPETHEAHAWVEVDGEVVGPPPGRLGHVAMARYGTASSHPSNVDLGDAPPNLELPDTR